MSIRLKSLVGIVAVSVVLSFLCGATAVGADDVGRKVKVASLSFVPEKWNKDTIENHYNEMVEKLTQFEPADRPNMQEVLQMFNELIRINQIHYDFDYFANPDTDPLTGKKNK